MLEKFVQKNRIEAIQRWLSQVDTNIADISAVEKDIYAALSKATSTQRWRATPIAPLAEPVDLNELVGDLFSGARDELQYQASRVDNIYEELANLNNTIKSELDTVDKNITEASDAIQSISIVTGDESRNFLWLSDSFNNSAFVDSNQSTALIDTDYGMATLAPAAIEILNNYDVNIDLTATKGIPGCNLLVLDVKNNTDKSAVPDVRFEGFNSRNLSAMLDGDAQSWFEVERNFVTPDQKLVQQGVAYVNSEAGTQQSVQKVTQNFDWKINVTWPDGTVQSGEDGKGIPVAEFIDLDGRFARTADLQEFAAVLTFDVVFKEPTAFSSFKLLPFTRSNEVINIDSIVAVLEDNTMIDVARDVQLGYNKSTTKLQREILRRTGSNTVGSLYAVPTDRPIVKLRFQLSSLPAKAPRGLGHIFKFLVITFRTERHYVFWSSVDKGHHDRRVPYDEKPVMLKSERGNPKLIGSVLNIAQGGMVLGNLYNNIQGQRNANVLNTAGSLLNANSAFNAAKIGGTLGSVGAWLGKAVPYIGAILALDDLVGGLFNVEHTDKVEKIITGYDVFAGYRSAVALRDLTLMKNQYAGSAIIQSVKRQFPGSVSKVGIFVDEEIPPDWGPGEWIKYYLSTDGVNWVQVSKLGDVTIENSFTPEKPITDIYFKAVLTGNSADQYRTPALRHYALQGLPSG